MTADELVVGLSGWSPPGRAFGMVSTSVPRIGCQRRRNWQLLGDGYAIEWPDLDEHVGIEGLLAGRRGGEKSADRLKRWLATRHDE